MKQLSQLPLNEVVPFSSIREMLSLAGREAGNRYAFRYHANNTIVSVTYRDFLRDVFALGAALHERALSDAHIAVISENSYPWATVFLTALAGNGVFVPVDTELSPHELLSVLRHSDSSVIFYSDAYASILEEHADELSDIRLFVRMGESEKATSQNSHFVSYTSLIHRGRALVSCGYTGFSTLKTNPEAMRMIAYTSGTTGHAKGVMLSERNLCASVYHGLRVAQVYDVYLALLPFYHLYESVCGILVALHHHGTICIGNKDDNIMQNFARFQPEYAYIVPAYAEEMYRRIWANARRTNRERNFATLIQTSNSLRRAGIDMRASFFSSIIQAFGGHLKKLVCGSAPLRAELGQFFEDIGIQITNGYGMTECSPLVAVNRDGANDPATVGMPLPCYEIRFADVGDDGEGEICLRSDTIMLGYYKDPERTAKALTSDGWFFTGDYGRLRSDGYLTITGRKKNIIVLSNGKKIYPEELQTYLRRIPYVQSALVYSSQNELGNETALYAELTLSREKLAEMHITQPQKAIRGDVAQIFAPLPYYKHISKIIIREEP